MDTGRLGIAVNHGMSSQTAQSHRRLSSLFIGLGLVGFFVAGVITLPHYGLTWDEALGNLFFGQRYFHYFTSLNPEYLDFEKRDPVIDQRRLDLYVSPFGSKP